MVHTEQILDSVSNLQAVKIFSHLFQNILEKINTDQEKRTSA